MGGDGPSERRFLGKTIGSDGGAAPTGATVVVTGEAGNERTVSIVGTDEIDPTAGRVSWISPIAKALLRGSLGDVVTMRTPRGNEELEIVAIRYDELP